MGGPGGPGRPQPFAEAKKIAQPKSEKELASAIKQLADELASVGRFSGSVLVAADGKPLIENAWGEADREDKVPNKPDTSYDVGSIGKLFTQIAILQLVEAGKVTLDDPFGKYLTNYPNTDVAGQVTIRQLLLHSSGMGDFLDSITPDTKLSSMRQLEDFLPLFAQKPLEFAPGSQTHYSNTGYVVLGMVVETVSGDDYYKYVEEHILKSADMAHTGFFDRTRLPGTVAHSYDDGRDVTNNHPVRGSPAGGLQASAGDLFRLVKATDAGKLLKKESVKLLRDLIPHPPNAPPPEDETRLVAYGIAGGAPGVSAYLAIDPTGRYTRVVLCNGSPPMATSMAATISEWIKQMPK
jgi:D-alanyl-D-alanine carboxypeptidase